jgi:hypothetical protein
MTSRRLLWFFAVLAICIATYSPNLLAQGSDLGTIRGTVTDSSGAVIPNAQVKITNTGNLQVYTYKTDERGSYLAPALVPGAYKAAITAPGFETSVITGIVLNGSDVSQQNAALHPATQTVNVEVTSEAVGINTDNSTLAQTLNSTAVLNLPRDSRDINQFLYIDPNISEGSGDGFKAVGTQSYGFSFSLDGQRNSGGIFGSQTSSEPSLESVGEVNILTNSFSAEYAGVMNVRINTKGGGAQNHGSLFYNDLNSGLAANAYQLPTKTHSNDTQFGGSWGGPIPHVKNTFFFAAYEYWDAVSPIFENSSGHILSPKVQSGDYSEVAGIACGDLPNLATIAADSPGGAAPAGLTTESCGAKTVVTSVPSSVQNAFTSKIVSLYFPQNLDSSGVAGSTNSAGLLSSYRNSYPGSDKQHMGDLRIDHDFNDRNRIYGVYHGSAEDRASSFVSFPYTGLGLNHTARKGGVLSLSYTHVFTPNLINEARGGYNIQDEYTHDNLTVSQFLSSIGFSPAELAEYDGIIGAGASMYGNPNIAFSSTKITTFGDDSRNSDRNLTQHLATFGDTVTYQKGRHAMKFGADFVRNEAQDGFGSTRNIPQSSMTYNGGAGLVGFTNFLLGNAPHSYQYVELPRPATDVSNWETAYFAQDDFKVNSRLTVNAGFRYDRYTPYVDKNDIMANFDPNYRNAATGQIGEYIVPSTKTLQYLQYTETDNPPKGIGYAIASETGEGIGRGLVRPDRFDFGPRAGFAYRITDKQVFRGGFGLFYPTSAAQGIRDAITTNPFNGKITGTAGATPIKPWPSSVSDTSTNLPVAGGVVTGFGNFPSANWIPFGLKNPRLMEWNATFEQQLPLQTTVRVSYIGSAQQGQIIGNDLDMIQASDNPFGTTTGLPQGNPNLYPITGYSGPYYGCDPDNVGDCAYSEADNSRIEFPELGDYVTGFGNHGKSMTNSGQIQAERKAKGLTFSVAYTFMDQKSSAADVGDSSLGGDNYNPFNGKFDYTRDSFVSRHRMVAYAVYDLPVGHGQRFAATANRVVDAIIGGWQASTNMFAKSGVGFTPSWSCGDCDPVVAGNIASGDEDAVGDFSGPSFRPNINGNPYAGRAPGYQFAPITLNSDSDTITGGPFGTPDLGATYWSNPTVAKRNSLTGPSTWGVNLGLHKSFRVNDRISVKLGADADNVFNHPMLSPDNPDTYANLGTIYMVTPTMIAGTDSSDCSPTCPATQLQPGQGTPFGTPGYQQQPALQPLSSYPGSISLNPQFGQNNVSYSQEGISGNRQIRLIGRITF